MALTAAVDAAGSAQIPVEPHPGHIVIDAVVHDKAGAPVLDLRPEELEVWIAGYRVPIESVTLIAPGAGQSHGRSLALILDDVTLDPAVMPRAREIATRFVDRMSEGDRLAIATMSGTISVESTDERARLAQAIGRYGPRATGVMRPDVLAAHVLQTITAASRQLANTSDRSAIVAIGPSWLFDTPIPPASIGGDLRPEWTNAMQTMALANVTLYVVDPGGVGMARTTSGSSGFARETGGLAFANTNDFGAAVSRILTDAASYYRLQVGDPPIGRRADLRDVDVRVLRRGLTVRARRAVPGGRER
jgi:VWFA-related protein